LALFVVCWFIAPLALLRARSDKDA
jgi:hypothetical protein